MNKSKCLFVAAVLVTFIVSPSVFAEGIEIQSFGHYKKMVHMKDTEGLVDLSSAIPAKNSYAVGAIQNGKGEITVLDGKPYLDYGVDGIGYSTNALPEGEKAVLLATATVENWNTVSIPGNMNKEQLFKTILSKAKAEGVNVDKPFPFQLRGGFKSLKVHVINGQNPKFAGHGSGEKLYHMITETRSHQPAKVIGFYSASNQGVYTHPGESWHLHAVIEDENAGVHVDDLHTGMHIKLLLPVVKQHDPRISLGLTPAEKAEFLSEMRQMLVSIQGIMTGIGTEDRDLIIKSARYSGNRMANATPDSVRQRLPDSFKQLGGPTHMMFEELIIRTETDDMDMLAEFTGELMQQCVACHETFKVD